MDKKKVLILKGGGSTEHDISLRSANYIESNLAEMDDFEFVSVEITKDGKWLDSNGHRFVLNTDRLLEEYDSEKMVERHFIDVAIPCLHGFPGETGDIPALFTIMGIPFIGAESQGSMLSWNKITTKLWLTSLGIPNTPYIFLNSPHEVEKAKEFFREVGPVFVKSACQGSSVGVFSVEEEDQLQETIQQAFAFSPYVLIEKSLKGFREIEMAVYEYQGEVHCSDPGEILVPQNTFYSYEEKYLSTSKTETVIPAKDISESAIATIKQDAIKAFKNLRLRHLARIDFFYSPTEGHYLNEPNTFPGMTEISLFPKLLEYSGHPFKSWLEYSLKDSLRGKL